MTDIEKFVSMLRDSERIVFFTGAGVSTESGLKDYRSRDGIYSTASEYGRPPEEILSHDCFFEDTELFYRFFRDFFLENAEPNSAHKAIAKLETLGKKVTVVTQNIDSLHEKAGSTDVCELHGTTAKLHCVKCSREFTLDCVKNSKTNVPVCECSSVIKPDVVLYGEMLDDNTVSHAIDAIEKADMLVIGGTSLAVYPAAGFVSYFTGKYMVIINKDATPRDGEADLVFHDGIGKILSAAVDKLEKE
ncbi:MAG: NAD-dependent protein deacylase [Oscillospiraceae bacterium]|nr:NAD-dependent protein deacylase [Oscillospiraceae bacterium]